MADGVVVLGMHRSGTSAATRLLGLLGLRMPVESDLVQPDVRNPTGYWESVSLVAFTNRVLWAVGSDMHCPLDLGPGWERDARLDELRAAAPEAVQSAFGGAPWAWKDPRNCLALAFWRSALPPAPALLVHRSPLEIAVSAERSRRPDGKLYTLALWERYLRQALTQTEGLPVLVTRYEDLLSDPLGWCARAREFLAAAGVAVGDVQEEAISAFVDPDLRRSSHGAEAVLSDPDISSQQRELYLLLEREVGAQDAFSPPALPPETPTTEALFAERRRALGRERELLEQHAAERAARWPARLRRSRLLAPVRALYGRSRAG